MKEQLAKQEGQKWGFPKPTLIIDSQSAAPLRGIEAEQVYYRMFLMGKPQDIAVTNYPTDTDYLAYLQDTLNVELPQFLQIPQAGTGYLTGDILAQPEVKAKLAAYGQEGYKTQFFNLTDGEAQLAKELGNPTYIKDFNAGEVLGTKTGFREFCMGNGIPMPAGAVCQSFDEVMRVVGELDGHGVVVKSYAGTGGAELGSNVKITAEDLHGKDAAATVAKKMESLKPVEPPYTVEQFLPLPEASLHVFLDDDGNAVFEPTVFGQFAHDGSYVGGHYPNGFTPQFNEKMKQLANEKIVPALKKIGATGMHCMDFLYDPVKNDMYFIEDNTRPGALDFVNQFTLKVADANRLQNPHWYHYQLPITEITGGRAVDFKEVMEVLNTDLLPGESFALISNPNPLPYGYNLHMTGVSTGEGASPEKAKLAYVHAMDKLKSHYGCQHEIHIP